MICSPYIFLTNKIFSKSIYEKQFKTLSQTNLPYYTVVDGILGDFERTAHPRNDENGKNHQSNVHGRLIGVHNFYCNMKYKIDCLPIVSFGMGQEYPYELD